MSTQIPVIIGRKNPKLTLILCFFLGIFGIHRFYLGKYGTGFLMLISLGGLGLWAFIDLINIMTNKCDDATGQAVILINNPRPYKKALVVITSLILWFAFYISAFIAFIFYITSGVTNTIQNQLEALRTGHIDTAYYSYSAKDFKKIVSLEQFKNFLAHYPSLQNNKTVFFNQRQIENNTGFAKGTLTAKDGAQTAIEYQLIKEDGAWKILNIKVLPTGAAIEIKKN